MGLIICSIFSMWPQVDITSPVASKQEGYQLEGRSVTYTNKDFTAKIMPLDVREFRAFLISRGVAASYLETPALQKRLSNMAVFELRLTNQGEQPLLVTPDRAVLTQGRRPVARLAQMMDIIPPSDPTVNAGDEALAAAIARSSQSIGPRDTFRQVIVFLPLLGNDEIPPRQLTFRLDQIYCGIDSHSIEGSFMLGRRPNP